MKASTREQPGRPLIRPLAAPRPSQTSTGAGIGRPNSKPSGPSVESAETPKLAAAKPKPDRPVRTFFCAGCGVRAQGHNVPPGWVAVKRIHSRGSKLPPPAIKDQPKAVRKWLVRPPELSLGLYCSITCLPADQARLAEEERRLNAKGVGLKPLDDLRELLDALKS